jgi:hypothetical protein
LVANCAVDAGTSVSSGVYLPSYVTNTEGKLEVCQFDCSYPDDIQGPQSTNKLLLMLNSGKRSMFKTDLISLLR